MAATFNLFLTKLPSRCPKEKCGFWKLFSKHERTSAKIGQKRQTMGKKTYRFRTWFFYIYSKWQKPRRQLASNSNFCKDAFQLDECNKSREIPLFRQFFMFFKNQDVSECLKENLSMREKTLYLGDSTISYAFCSNFATFTVFRTEKNFQIKTIFPVVFEKSYYINRNQSQTICYVLVTTNSWFKIVNLQYWAGSRVFG